MNPVLYTLVALSLASSIGVAVYAYKLHQRLNRALNFGPDTDLESLLTGHNQQITQVDQRLGELEKLYTNLTITASVASQKISVVRFNPFGDTGGDQSFALAVLDAHDSGYVLSSIHGRQGTRVYVKPIDFAKSRYGLSDEERQAISQAIKRTPPSDTTTTEGRSHE
ncbi:DUF4446 family protein [bacterium]|nr:MAG: DUF4446 family protein [bacterium]